MKSRDRRHGQSGEINRYTEHTRLLSKVSFRNDIKHPIVAAIIRKKNIGFLPDFSQIAVDNSRCNSCVELSAYMEWKDMTDMGMNTLAWGKQTNNAQSNPRMMSPCMRC